MKQDRGAGGSDNVRAMPDGQRWNIITEYECDWTNTVVVYGQRCGDDVIDTVPVEDRSAVVPLPDVASRSLAPPGPRAGQPPKSLLTLQRLPTLASGPSVGAIGDPREVPSICTNALWAPTWQDKPSDPLALAPEVGNDPLSCPASLGRPPEPSDEILGRKLPPKLQHVSGVPATGDPIEVPSVNSDEHAAPSIQDGQAILPASALAPVVAHSAPARLAGSTKDAG